MRPVGFSTTPNLVLRLPMWRSRLMLFLLFFVFMLLLIRAFWIQGPGNAFYEAKGVRGTQRELELPASRGKILDRNGQVIATSLEAKSVIAYNDTVPDDLSAEKVKALDFGPVGMGAAEFGKLLIEDCADSCQCDIKIAVGLVVTPCRADADLPCGKGRVNHRRQLHHDQHPIRPCQVNRRIA